MNLLELFSGTHSIGYVASSMGYNVISVDRDLDGKSKIWDYESHNHIKEDIMTWEYKKYPKHYFKVITASPVCLYWSKLRNSWLGRKSHQITGNKFDIVTKEHIENDIENYGKPMVDKIIEIIEYFEPKYWWIENPSTGKMKYYIEEKHSNYNKFYDVDYCKYSDWGYKKTTRIWTNIKNFNPKKCKNDCNNMKNKKQHIKIVSNLNVGNSRLQSYRIPPNLIKDLLNNCI